MVFSKQELVDLKLYFSDFKQLKRLSGPVLITGHTGFKGTWLTLMLESLGVQTCGYSLPAEVKSLYQITNRINKIEEQFSDIRDFKSLNDFIKKIKPSIVIHFAAQPLVLESYSNPKLTFETNVLGTVNTLEASFRSDSTQVVLVSTTDKVYKNTNSNKKFSEDDQLEGDDPYSASKVAAESAIKAWQKIGLTSHSPTVLAARSGNVIGGGDFSKNRLIPDLVRGFSSNETVYIRNSSSTRPWQHVTDSLYGYLRYIEEALISPTHNALNFGPIKKSKTVQEVVEIAQKTWGGNTNVEYQNNRSKIESNLLDLDPSLAMSTLKWQPYLTQEQAVSSSMNWWKKLLIEKVSAIDCCIADIKNLIR